MEQTEYTIFRYDGKEYLRFESHEKNFLGVKNVVMRFIPTRSMYDENGNRIKKWTVKKFPKQINMYNKNRLIYGNQNLKNHFIENYPDIKMYINDLNSGELLVY